MGLLKHSQQSLFLLCILSWVTGSQAQTASVGKTQQDHKEVLEIGTQFLRARVANGNVDAEIHITPPDSRLRLSQCTKDLQPFLPAGATGNGRITLGMKCSGDQPWQVFLAAEVIEKVRVLIAKHPLPKGHTLSPTDTEWKEFNQNRVPADSVKELPMIQGKITSRFVAAGRPLQTGLLSDPITIFKDDIVQIIYDSKGMQVSSTGIALQNGATGEKIRVRNRSSQREVEGRIKSPGVIKIFAN